MTTRRWFQSTWAQFCRWALGLPIRIKIMGIALGLILALGFAFLFWMQTTLTRALRYQLTQRAISLGGDVAARSRELVLTNDLVGLYQLLRDTQENNSDVRYVFVVDDSGKVLAHTFGTSFPPDLLTFGHLEKGERHKIEEIDTEEGGIHDVAIPILGTGSHTVRLGVTEVSLRQTLHRISRELIAITVIASLLGIIAAYVLTITLTRPIFELVQAAHAVSAGDFTKRVQTPTTDEVGRLGLAFNLMVERLDTYRYMQTQLVQKLITAQEEERKRIARELHDQTSQSLTSMMVGLRLLEESVSMPDQKHQVTELRGQASLILQDLHELSADLRPNTLDDLGLVVALQQHAQQCAERYGLVVDFQTVDMENVKLSAEEEIALYRIVQESLSNVLKHAQAQNASVLLERRKDILVVIVEDDGVGFDPTEVAQSKMQDKLGLFGIQERVTLIGGKLTIESQPGHGTSLFIEIPLTQNSVLSPSN